MCDPRYSPAASTSRAASTVSSAASVASRRTTLIAASSRTAFIAAAAITGGLGCPCAVGINNGLRLSISGFLIDTIFYKQALNYVFSLTWRVITNDSPIRIVI